MTIGIVIVGLFGLTGFWICLAVVNTEGDYFPQYELSVAAGTFAFSGKCVIKVARNELLTLFSFTAFASYIWCVVYAYYVALEKEEEAMEGTDP